ncbi:hypothetical protein DPX16_7040 [Anabarilius grahami]|uniref:Uncharacterized protein n=1 Tax=Anabarilius grahami TaxID=495550 RepID=A0A3N0Y2F1_ANAGA|nr:hypothetical protein DPX16_7040 [Anabarilius grahami]
MHDSPIGLCNFLLQVECYGPVNQLVGVAKQHKGVELQSSLQSQNGDVERHEKKSCEGRHPTLDKNAAENGLPRQSGCRAESSPDSSLSPSLENGFVTSQDSEKYEEETLPTLPRKKRGRRKLERPTKLSEGWVDRDVSILAACLDWVQCTERQQVCVVATLSVGVVPGEWHNAQGTYTLILHQSALPTL